MKLGIVGNGLAGKDAVAEILRDHHGFRYVAGTSYFARYLVFKRLTEMGVHYPDADAAWSDRRSYRSDWARIIGEYNATDPIALYRDCLAEQDLLTGIRWRHEYKACRDAQLVDYWIWVERPGWPSDSTCQVTREDCDLVVVNDGTLEDLRGKVAKMLLQLRPQVFLDFAEI